MRNRRWDKAAMVNEGDPSPMLPQPNAYDINLRIVRAKPFPSIYIGPVRTVQPASLIPYDNYNIWWTPQVSMAIDSKDTISKYLVTKAGPRQIKIDWRKGTKVLATTFYDLIIIL